MLAREFMEKYWFIRNSCGYLGAEKRIEAGLLRVLQTGQRLIGQITPEIYGREIPLELTREIKELEETYQRIKKEYSPEMIESSESRARADFAGLVVDSALGLPPGFLRSLV